MRHLFLCATTHIEFLWRSVTYEPEQATEAIEYHVGARLLREMLLWVTGDGPHAIRDCRFLSFDARSGEIRRGCHRQIATRKIARRRSRSKRESKIPLNGCAF